MKNVIEGKLSVIENGVHSLEDINKIKENIQQKMGTKIQIESRREILSESR